jgi:hypothetical protein
MPLPLCLHALGTLLVPALHSAAAGASQLVLLLLLEKRQQLLQDLTEAEA